MFTIIALSFTGLIILFAVIGTKIVPEKDVFLIERLGKYHRTLNSGMHFIVPILDRVAYKQTYKEQTIEVGSQEAMTKDSISMDVSGFIYLAVIDAHKASYNVENWEFSIISLCKTIMRSAIGDTPLDETFSSRKQLNQQIVDEIKATAELYGISLTKYELGDVNPSETVTKSMEKAMVAERDKRSLILSSQGRQEAAVNTAQGEKDSAILEAEGASKSKILLAEADKQEQVLKAQGEAESISIIAKAKADSIMQISVALGKDEGGKAANFELALNAIDAKKAIAKESTVLILSDKQNDPSETVVQAIALSQSLTHTQSAA